MASLSEKIVLGTVQLGLPYGINNKSGQPDLVEAHRILDKAARANISLLDSAEAYGDSLSVIGSYLKKSPHAKFKLISKFSGGERSLSSSVSETLSATNSTSLYALMYHRFSDFESGSYKQELLELRKAGKIGKIGISLYSEKELQIAVEDPDIALIQLPFNPLDASSEKKTLMEEAKSVGKEIHVRSVFFQGLFFKDPDDLTGNLTPIAPALRRLHSVVKENGSTIREACLNFALHQSFIDNVIIGVDTTDQLEQNLNSIMTPCPEWILRDLEVEIPDKYLLNPSNWLP